ncbi:MAG: hypothetical protein VZT48_09210 [Bulleidia sp.]|nr:hypothetical protein [Bulleidia sp.]
MFHAKTSRKPVHPKLHSHARKYSGTRHTCRKINDSSGLRIPAINEGFAFTKAQPFSDGSVQLTFGRK